MALQWEPQWEDVVIEVWGIRIKVKRDKITGMYACPVCGASESSIYFFSPEDLIRHLVTHVKREKVELIHVSLEEEVEKGAKLEEVGEEG